MTIISNFGYLIKFFFQTNDTLLFLENSLVKENPLYDTSCYSSEVDSLETNTYEFMDNSSILLNCKPSSNFILKLLKYFTINKAYQNNVSGLNDCGMTELIFNNKMEENVVLNNVEDEFCIKEEITTSIKKVEDTISGDDNECTNSGEIFNDDDCSSVMSLEEEELMLEFDNHNKTFHVEFSTEKLKPNYGNKYEEIIGEKSYQNFNFPDNDNCLGNKNSFFSKLNESYLYKNDIIEGKTIIQNNIEIEDFDQLENVSYNDNYEVDFNSKEKFEEYQCYYNFEYTNNTEGSGGLFYEQNTLFEMREISQDLEFSAVDIYVLQDLFKIEIQEKTDNFSYSNTSNLVNCLESNNKVDQNKDEESILGYVKEYQYKKVNYFNNTIESDLRIIQDKLLNGMGCGKQQIKMTNNTNYSKVSPINFHITILYTYFLLHFNF